MDELQRRLYLALHRGSPGDAAFYVATCSGAASVLELGVGNARLLSQLDVPRRAGLDIDAGMIEAANAACPDARLFVADMASFRLDESFERIIIPSSALFALPSREAQQSCLECCARHLASPGELWLDAYASDAFHEEAEPTTDDLGRSELEVLDDIEVSGESVRVYEANIWSRDDQRFDVVYWFELKDRVVEQPLTHHYLLRDQLLAMGAAVGLELIDQFSSFDRRPFTRESERLIVGFRRAGGGL